MFLILFLVGLVNAVPELYNASQVVDFTSTCGDKRAIKCFIVYPNLEHIEDAEYIKIWGQGFDHVTFHRVKRWELRGNYLSEFEVNSEKNYGYITILHSFRDIWGFFEFNGARYSIYGTNTLNSQRKPWKIIKQWTTLFNETSRRQYPNFEKNHV